MTGRYHPIAPITFDVDTFLDCANATMIENGLAQVVGTMTAQSNRGHFQTATFRFSEIRQSELEHIVDITITAPNGEFATYKAGQEEDTIFQYELQGRELAEFRVEVRFKPLPESYQGAVQEGVRVTTCSPSQCSVPRLANLTLNLTPDCPKTFRLYLPIIMKVDVDSTSGVPPHLGALLGTQQLVSYDHHVHFQSRLTDFIPAALLLMCIGASALTTYKHRIVSSLQSAYRRVQQTGRLMLGQYRKALNRI